MKITILHNPRCSKSRHALEEATKCGYQVEIIEYLKDTPSVKELKELLAKLDMKAEEIVRKKEPLYRELCEGKKFSESQWLKLLHENPVLIERPILVKNKKAVLGRTEEALKEIL